MDRRTAAVLVLAAAGCAQPAPPPAPPPPSTAIVDAAKTQYEIAKGYLTRALEQVPEAKLSYRATPDVRTFAQLFAHVADANYMFCSYSRGEPSPSGMGEVEKTKTTKADIQKALADSFAYCDRAFAGLNDTSGAAGVTLEALNNMKTTRLGALTFNTMHDFEHYGNVVTYMRLNKMVPPSSQRQGM
jgi:uncharacterized damage-inducible protein DinB